VSQFIKLQSTMGGIGTGSNVGTVTVFGMYDRASGVLLVDQCKSLKAGEEEVRRRDHAVLSNNSDADDVDQLFEDSDLQDALQVYMDMAGRGLVVLEAAVAQYDPGMRVEQDGTDDRGRRLRIAKDIGPGHLAVITLCWWARRQVGVAQLLDEFDSLDDDMLVRSFGFSGSDELAGGQRDGLSFDASGWPIEGG
jgi:hypothetical protein